MRGEWGDEEKQRRGRKREGKRRKKRREVRRIQTRGQMIDQMDGEDIEMN